jgi:uncharacterized membrane protein YeaQ/YmgE (transglycosylase-associated protein family)
MAHNDSQRRKETLVDFVSFLVSLISGAIGGNVAGAAMEDKSLGLLGNSLAGVLGGNIGTALLQMVGIVAHSATVGDVTLGGILSNVASGGVGGAVLLIVISIFRGILQRA